MTRRVLHRLWRFGARALPVTVKRDWLPGYGAVEALVRSWLHTLPSERQRWVELWLPHDHVGRVLARAGGVRSAFRTVLADEREDGLGTRAEHWRTPENVNPSVDDVASALIQIAGACGIRLDLETP